MDWPFGEGEPTPKRRVFCTCCGEHFAPAVDFVNRMKAARFGGNPVVCPVCWDTFPHEFHLYLLECIPTATGAIPTQ